MKDWNAEMISDQRVASVDLTSAHTGPAIRGYEMRPPVGGWGVRIEVKGHPFEFYGTPMQIVSEISKIQRANDVFVSEDEVWRFCNDVWCRREPSRCLLKITWIEDINPDLATESLIT